MKTTLDLDRLARELGMSAEDAEWIEAANTAADERQAKYRGILSAGREPTLTTREKILALATWAEAQKWRNATDLYAYTKANVSKWTVQAVM
jgi:hypothetical protein